MLDRLPESRRSASRPVATFAVAAGLHALLAVAALRASVPPPAPARPGAFVIIEHFTLPDAPVPTPGPAAAAGDAAAHAPLLPPLPTLTTPDGVVPFVPTGSSPLARPSPGAPVDLGGLLGPATPISEVVGAAAGEVVPPRFLMAGRSPLSGSGVRGRVTLRFVVDTLGRAEAGSVEIVEAPDSVLAAAARVMVIGARFEPGRSAGHRVRVRVRQNVTFDR